MLILSLVFGNLVLLSTNPILSLIYFNVFVLISSCVLAYLDLLFFGIAFIVIYIGAITIFFIFLIMMIDIRLIRNFSVSYDNVLNILFSVVVVLMLYIIIFLNYNFEFNLLNMQEVPINSEALEIITENNLFFIGLLFSTDYFILIIACFLLLICIIIYIIGYKDHAFIETSI